MSLEAGWNDENKINEIYGIVLRRDRVLRALRAKVFKKTTGKKFELLYQE